MNKKKMSIIIVSFTLITVFIMIFTSHFGKDIDTEEDKTLIFNNKIQNMPSKKLDVDNHKNIDNAINNNSENDRYNSESIKQSSDKSNNDEFSTNTSNDIENKKGNSTEQNNESNKYNSYSNDKEDINQNQNENLFKVSKEKIPSELTFSDKMKILSISKSLSSGDLNKLQVDINNNNEKKGISDAIYLLKTRLDSKDFKNIKDIASRFINLDSIND